MYFLNVILELRAQFIILDIFCKVVSCNAKSTRIFHYVSIFFIFVCGYLLYFVMNARIFVYAHFACRHSICLDSLKCRIVEAVCCRIQSTIFFQLQSEVKVFL